MKKLLFKFLKAGIFVSVVFLVCFLVLSINGLKSTKAAPVSIDCSVGTPRTITEGVDFNTVVADDLTLDGVGTCVIVPDPGGDDNIELASLVVGDGADATVLTHQDNTTTQANWMEITTTGNITVNANASIDADGLGYNGGATQADGEGPAGGYGVFGGSNAAGSGGAHGGDGGDEQAGAAGGTAYCDISDPATIGAGGGGTHFAGGNGGDGGGSIILNASGDIDITGATITADGTDGVEATGRSGGGGAGGGIKMSADRIIGSPTSFSVTGGDSPSAANFDGGGGGGGCVLLEYTTSSSISDELSIDMYGGTAIGTESSQHGGAGQLLIHDTDAVGEDGDLFSENNGTEGADTTQLISSLSVDSITLDSEAKYVVSNGDTLTLNDATPFDDGDSTGILEIAGELDYTSGNSYDNLTVSILSGGTLGNTATIDVTATGGLTLNSGGIVNTTITTLTSAGTLTFEEGSTFTISDITTTGGTITLNSYTTASAMSITGSLTIGGTTDLIHGDNSDSQTHIINVSAASMDIDGSIDVDGLGYEGGAVQANGEGPIGGGYGVYVGANAGGSGGAHEGNGGNDETGTAIGGTAYCDETDPDTIGAGGGGSYFAGGIGGNGGGLIILNASGTVDVDGATITADGTDGVVATARSGGGGGGGGVKIAANTISGDPASFTVTGGNSLDAGDIYDGGGGGGGCIYLEYRAANSIDAGDVDVSGGTAGAGSEAGGVGDFNTTQLNQYPTVSINGALSKTNGSGTADISLELDDGDDDTLSAEIEYKAGADCSSGTSDPTLDETPGSFSADTGTPTVDNSAVTYQISNVLTSSGSNTVQFDWLSATDAAAADGTYCIRVTPYDGTDTGTPADASFTLDNVNPTASGNLTSSSIATDSLTYTLGAAGSDTNINQYTTYYKAGASGVIRSDTLSDTVASGSYTQGNTTQISSLTTNTQYVTNIWTEDSYGNNDSATELAIYTAANAPGSSTVDNPATTTLDVALDINSNPAITEFAIQETGSSNYVQADNSLGAAAAWQDNSTWSTATVSGLSLNTTYTFQTKARNGDSVETAFGTTTSLYTLAEVPTQPTIDNLTTNSLDITLGSDSNPDYTTYAIQVSNGTASYVQADGSLGASEVWQNTATWGTTTVTGLSADTSYTTQVKARNEDGVETSLSTTGSGDTEAEAADSDDGDGDGDEDGDGDTSSEDDLSPSGGVYKERTDSEGTPVLIDLNSKILATSGPGEITRLWAYDRRGEETDVKINEGLFPTSYLSGAGIIAIDQSNNLVKDQFAIFARNNGGPQVRVMSLESDGTLVLRGQDFLFQNPDDEEGTSSIRDGLSLTVGDFDNDSYEDDIAACLTGDYIPRIKVFKDATGVDDWELLHQFDVPAIGANGCNLSTFQYDDGLKELLITPNHGPSSPNVYVYTLGGTRKAVFQAYDDSINQGLTASGIEDRIYTTPNNGSSHVRAFNGAGSPKNFWWAYDEEVRGNFKNVPGDIDLDGKDEILISPMGSNGTQVLSYEATGVQRSWPNFFAFGDETLRNGVGVAVIENWHGVN